MDVRADEPAAARAATRADAEFDRVLAPDGASELDATPIERAPAPEPTGSRLDDAWQRWMGDPRIRRAWEWGAPAAVLAIAAAARLIGLDHPHELVFDETYYVKDAYSLSHLGYEARWPTDANVLWASGHPGSFLDEPSYVVHPPLGKWIIAAGIAAFGAENSAGWRIATALAGILLVALTMLVARRLFGSTTLAVVAGGLLAIDGNAIVLSRVALLDGILAFFALLGAYLVLLDRGWSQRRLAGWIAARRAAGLPIDRGPVLWWRPWLLAAAVAFGCATSVKWSGLYFLAIFGVYTVVADALLRRRAGIAWWGVGSALRQGPVNALLLVPLALLVYLASWTGWFTTSGGYFRHWIEDGGGTPWSGGLAWVPYWFQNWWHYQADAYSFHVGLHTPHSYQANPLTWLFLIRPTSMHYQDLGGGVAEAILDVANPLIWWGGTAALGFLVVRLVLSLRARRGIRGRRTLAADAFILTGIAAGYLPWLLYLDRTVFQFYTIVFEPFLVLALTAALAAVAGRASDSERRRTAGLTAVGVFLGLVVLVSLFFLPMWTGIPIPIWFMRLHYWLGNSWI